MTTRVHYLVDGNANVAFTLRRQEFFIPVGIVLKVSLVSSDSEGNAVYGAQIPLVKEIQDCGPSMNNKPERSMYMFGYVWRDHIWHCARAFKSPVILRKVGSACPKHAGQIRGVRDSS